MHVFACGMCAWVLEEGLQLANTRLTCVVLFLALGSAATETTDVLLVALRFDCKSCLAGCPCADDVLAIQHLPTEDSGGLPKAARRGSCA